jgi:hypothetical protein
MSRKMGLLAAAAPAVALTVVPATLAAGVTTSANGADYLLPNGHVYQLANGSNARDERPGRRGRPARYRYPSGSTTEPLMRTSKWRCGPKQ